MVLRFRLQSYAPAVRYMKRPQSFSTAGSHSLLASHHDLSICVTIKAISSKPLETSFKLRNKLKNFYQGCILQWLCKIHLKKTFSLLETQILARYGLSMWKFCCHLSMITTLVYTVCDFVRKVVGQFEKVQRHAYNLEILVKLNYQDKGDERHLICVLTVAYFLLRPFLRLRNVSNPQIHLTTRSYRISATKVIVSDSTYPKIRPLLWFQKKLKYLEEEISSTRPVPECSGIEAAYMKLECLVCIFRLPFMSPFHKSHDILDTLIRRARVAREMNDLPEFRKVCDEVVKIWSDYLDKHARIRERISGGIDCMYGMIDKLPERTLDTAQSTNDNIRN